MLPPYTPRKSNPNNFSFGDSFPRLHHNKLTINSKGATYCSTLVIRFKAKRQVRLLREGLYCSTLVIRFKAKRRRTDRAAGRYCSTLVIRFKAKRWMVPVRDGAIVAPL